MTVLWGNIDSNKQHLNTAENRKAWANTIVEFFNHPSNASRYNYFTPFQFGGDITPNNTTNWPYLSDYLTYQDTMECARIANSGASNDGGKLPISDVLMEPALMALYFSPQHMEGTKKHFEQYYTASKSANPWEETHNNNVTEDDFHDVGDFHLS
jgi:hypothetical protein